MIVALPLFAAEPNVEDRPADCDLDNQEFGSMGCKACEDGVRAGALVGEELPVVKVLKLL